MGHPAVRDWTIPKSGCWARGSSGANKKFSKPIDEIAFRNQDKNWKPHIELTLDHLKLARDFASLLLHRFRKNRGSGFQRES